MKDYSLANYQKYTLLLASFFIVAFGQPAWVWWLGLIASVGGFACFWRVLLAIPRKRERFCLAMGWYAAVQMVQLSWFASHPYLYIYAVLFFCAWLMGAQFGLLALFIQPAAIKRLPRLLGIASLWVFLEWSRLFILSGLAFNPTGLALSGALYPLQLAAFGGMYFLSFWVMLTNLFVLRIWLNGSLKQDVLFASAMACLPYLIGAIHFHFHEQAMRQHPSTVSVMLVQPALPIEEKMVFQSAEEARQFVLDEWMHILATTQKQLGQSIDLIVLPEYVVPYGTYHPVFPLKEIEELLTSLFGSQVLQFLPPLEEPYASYIETDRGPQWLASNAFLAQAVANLFKAHIVIGLEDSVYVDEKAKHYESYSAAFHFPPSNQPAKRYEKRVLVPMGEYIPFDFCRKLAAQYGISGSFTCGKEAKVFAGPVPFGTSICYEEMYGNLMRENRQKGAELLVNLTNDGWYPNSRLPQQHFDHARLRTVENGIPLVRACNTGITGALDSLGRPIGTLGEERIQLQSLADSIRLDVPAYHYATLYAKWGDAFILSVCGCLLLWGLIDWKRR
ncbi:apolipoprotein N-acyltransferase [Candidatus Protochlamydia phocaeensis]|uniref:apolipoprotein N-acyltransferase n=1 Tax=Candidatus Protochlamydia phocaeensis TaxID=1414722 RepID=UPI0008388FD3|nr:apolipoprotein N-acyltransferase [Candidatus Protochlamydia phocaeensis]